MRLFKIHPLLKLVNSYVVDSPQPSNLSYWWNFGSLLAFSLIIQIVTGVTLAMHYNTDIIEAFNSVEYIMRDINNGWLIRYLHSNTASAFFFIVYLHIGRGLYYGSYKTPRTLAWTIGTIIFISMMATAFLGYVLPFGQMSLWGATVITSLMSAIPWVGQDIVEFIWGGFSVNHATLNRFFALHFVLPFVLAALALMHLIALHDRAGSGNPLGLSGNSDRLPFAPYYIFKDLITIFIFILVLSILVFYMPNILGDSENYVKANPMQTPTAIVPEWYLLPFYAILRSIPNKLLGVIAMFSAILMLLVMAFVDTNISRGIQFKPLNKIIFFLFVGNFLALTQLGAEHVESPFIEYGQISTILYFVYFLVIIPYICLFEYGLTELFLEKDLSLEANNVIGYNNENQESEYYVPEHAIMQSSLFGSYKFNFRNKINYNNRYKTRNFHTTSSLNRTDDDYSNQNNNITITNDHTYQPETVTITVTIETQQAIDNYLEENKDEYKTNAEIWERYEYFIKNFNKHKKQISELRPEDSNKACVLQMQTEKKMDDISNKCKNKVFEMYKSEGNENPIEAAEERVHNFLNEDARAEAIQDYMDKHNTESFSDNYEHLKDSIRKVVPSNKEIQKVYKDIERRNEERIDNERIAAEYRWREAEYRRMTAEYEWRLAEHRRATEHERVMEDRRASEHRKAIEDRRASEQIQNSNKRLKTQQTTNTEIQKPEKPSNCDAPRPWGVYFQDSGNPQMEALVELHNNIIFYLIIILFGVGWLLVTIINKFGDMASPLSKRFTSHGTTIEIIWTVTPGIILILIAFPSFKLLYLMDEIIDPIFAIFAKGHQWYWSYEFPDFLNDDYEYLEFDSYLVPETDLQNGALRMLEVDNRLIVPELTHIRFVVQGDDVIHSFACPALGLKCDAYPARLNQSSFIISRIGTFYGQCSEICGVLHSGMPTVIEAVSSEKFVKWLLQQ